MNVSNSHIARVLFRLAALVELAGDGPFKAKAYRTAAEQLLDLPESVTAAFRTCGKLPAVPGIGKAIAAKIVSLIETGTIPAYDKLASKVPESLLELLSVRGLGPATVRTLHQELDISDVRQLKAALEEGRLEGLKGFTPTTIDRIRRSLYEYMSYRGRFLRHEAEGLMKALLSYLRTCPAVLRAAPAGSFRRGRESVGNLNAVVATDAPEAVRSHVESWEEAQLPIVLDGAKLFFKLHAEVEADLLLVPEDRFGAAWHYQTGSAEHNRQLARLARTRGLVPQPGGLYAGQETLETRDEEAFFDRLGLPWIPPELREGRGELEAAQGSALPRLVEPGEIRGDLHMHTTFTDGTASMLEMALAAKALRYEYIAVCDHTHNVRVANGLSPDRVAQYLEEVDRVNALVGGFTVLKGLEVDILPDGTLDMPESILERLDLVIASVHSAFDQSEDLMTARVLKALDSRWVHVLGHPSGRLIGQRSPLLLDMEQVFARAAQRGKMLELNANPERLDLTDLHCRQVRQMGIPIVISTDAHSISQLANMPRGIFQARRGWLEADDILNTRPLPELRRMLAAVRGRGE